MTSSSPSSSASASPYCYDTLCLHLRITGKTKKRQDGTTKPATISTDRPTNRLKLVDRACVVHGGTNARTVAGKRYPKTGVANLLYGRQIDYSQMFCHISRESLFFGYFFPARSMIRRYNTLRQSRAGQGKAMRELRVFMNRT